MENILVTGMERRRSINLRIGFVVGLLASILSFNCASNGKLPIYSTAEEHPIEVITGPFTMHPADPSNPPAPLGLNTEGNILQVYIPQPAAFHSDTLTDAERSLTGKEEIPNPHPIFPPPPDEKGDCEPVCMFCADEIPLFPGCEGQGLSKVEKTNCANELLLKYLNENLRYPEPSRDNCIEGTVYLRFVVERDGSISNAQIIRDIGGGCGKEALRVVNNMPKWKPGKQRGIPVRVKFNLPVRFKLS